MSFSTLGLSETLLRAVREEGYDTPTPIQAQAIPPILKGRDVIAAAQTGTGKTAAFTLPLLHRLAEHKTAGKRRGRPPRALVLTPTRELAAQVQDSVVTYGRHLALSSLAVFGGVGIQPQIGRLLRGVDVLVATPGRLLDLHNQKAADLSCIEILVLDEADRMLDMGFIHDIRRIISYLPENRQNLLFSATFSNEVRKLIQGLLNNPEKIEVAARNTAAETVMQSAYAVNREDKPALLAHLIEIEEWSRVLVFTRTKHGADRLAKRLDQAGISATAIHGNKTQSARTRALDQFKRGKVTALVATDIAARGLDIEQLPQVVNFELPNVPEDYVHRIGRTGRAGATGHAVSLVSPDEYGFMNSIERLLGKRLERKSVPGFKKPKPPSAPRPAALQDKPKFEPRQKPKPKPKAKGRPARGGSSGHGGGHGHGSSHAKGGPKGGGQQQRRRKRGGPGRGAASA